MIDVLIVEPHKLPYKKSIANDYKSMQKIVGGLIETVPLLEDNSVILICNEEGKILNLPLNRKIGYDIIAGTFIIADDDYDNGEFISLTDEQMEKYKKRFDEHSIDETYKKILKILEKRKNKNNLEI